MNEELTNVSGTEMSDANVDYVAAIQELQNNTVSKEQYNKLKSENKKLLDALVSGQQIETPSESKVSVQDLRKKLFNRDSELTNLEYVETTLQLRDALIESGERDPFLPYGEKVQETAEQHDKANRVAEVLKECIDFADGDSGIFTAELQRRTKDVMPNRRR